MTIDKPRPVMSLGIEDLKACAVWEYVNLDSDDETLVEPVRRVPTETLAGRVVGIQVRLANGTLVWALLGNVDEENARSTEQFLLLSVFRDRQWFTLARYHDFDYGERGPAALARFLELPVDGVFPISYDIRAPRERLSKADLIALAVP